MKSNEESLRRHGVHATENLHKKRRPGVLARAACRNGLECRTSATFRKVREKGRTAMTSPTKRLYCLLGPALLALGAACLILNAEVSTMPAAPPSTPATQPASPEGDEAPIDGPKNELLDDFTFRMFPHNGDPHGPVYYIAASQPKVSNGRPFYDKVKKDALFTMVSKDGRLYAICARSMRRRVRASG